MNTRLYTLDSILKKIALLELHLMEIEEGESWWCMDCIGKHLYEIWGLADEGVGFFPEATEVWRKTGIWANKALDMQTLNPEQAKQLGSELREIRKEGFMPIVAKERKSMGIKAPVESSHPAEDLGALAGKGTEQMLREIVEAGGGQYVGIQRDLMHPENPPNVLFNDPLLQSSVTVPLREISVARVQQRIQEVARKAGAASN